MPILKVSQDNPQNIFLHFLTLWKHFYNLTIFREYPSNIFQTEIALWILKFAKRSMFFFVKSYICNTKTTFLSRICWKIFSFKMFPKCSLVFQNIVALKKQSANIPRILLAGWALPSKAFLTMVEKWFNGIKMWSLVLFSSIQIKKKSILYFDYFL